jgi:hypothetical protein
LRARTFTIDGEAVVCGPDGVAVFDARMPSHPTEVFGTPDRATLKLLDGLARW